MHPAKEITIAQEPTRVAETVTPETSTVPKGWLSSVVTLLGIAAAFALAVRRLDFGATWAFGDHVPTPYSVDVPWNRFVSAWNWTSVGLPGAPGSYYEVGTSWLSSAVGASTADTWLLVILLPIAGLSMFLFLRQFLPTSYSLLGGFFYAFNPITVSSFVAGEGGIQAGSLLLLSLAPGVLAVLQFTSNSKTALTVGLPVSVIFGVGIGLISSDLPTTAWLIGPPVLFYVMFTAALDERRLGRVLGYALTIAISALPFVILYSFGLSGVSSSPAAYLSFAQANAAYSYRTVTVLNLIRLSGSQGSPQWILGYNGSATWSVVGFVPFALVLFSLLFTRELRSPTGRLLVLSVALVLLSTVVGVLIQQGTILSLIGSSSFFGPLDDPGRVESWAAIGLAIGVSIGAVNLVNQIEHLLSASNLNRPIQARRARILARPFRRLQRIGVARDRRAAEATVAVAIVLAISVSNMPAFDGTLGLVTVRGSEYELPQYFSQYYSLLGNGSINSSESHILWLPYTGNLTPSLTWAAQMIFNPTYELPLYSNDTYVAVQLYGAICDFPAVSNFSRVLEALSIGYVVIDRAEAEVEFPNNATACEVGNSEAFPTITASNSFLDSFVSRLSGYSTISNSTDLEVLEGPASRLAFIGTPTPLGNPSAPVTNLLNVSLGSNLVRGGEPANASYWGTWPATNLTRESLENGTKVLNVTVSSQGETVASQMIPISDRGQVEIRYDLGVYDSSPRLRVLWFLNDTDTGDGDAVRIDYIPEEQVARGTGMPYLESFESVVTPPTDVTWAKVELVSTWPTSTPPDLSYALFGSISMSNYSLALNGSTVSIPADCFQSYNMVTPTELNLYATNCPGDHLIVLATSYDSGWQATVAGEGVAQSHGVADFYENGWQVHLGSGAIEISIFFGPQEQRNFLLLFDGVFGLTSILVSGVWLAARRLPQMRILEQRFLVRIRRKRP